MKKYCVSIILFFIFISSLRAFNIKVSTDKKEYLRYEIVTIFCKPINTETAFSPKSATATVEVFSNKRLINTVGNTSRLFILYNPVLNKWVGKWPIPWNPHIGTYNAVVIIEAGGKKQAGTATFNITKRIPPSLPKGFCVMDIEEPDGVIIKQVPGLGGRSVKTWENYVLWAKFMGANALWHCVGQSQIWDSFKPYDFPWSQIAMQQFPLIGRECHKYNIKYGAWMSGYVLLGNRKDLSPYRQTIGYDKDTGELHPLIYISIYDQKRESDIIELIKKLDASPDVDYIGLDYMRTDFGGYEYAIDFINDMPVYNIPENWENLDDKEKMVWLAKKLEVEHDPQIVEMWQWWRAHKMAIIIHEMVTKSGVKKPLWVFNLGWKEAKQHGQDPLMLIDAGLSINAAMFYSIDKKTLPDMIDDWTDYLRRCNTSLVVGQCVDWNLLGKTIVPTGPDEHFIRQKQAVDAFLPINPSLGLFWHDLTRAFKVVRGPYSALEWAIAGGATFTYLRKEQGVFPFKVEWEIPDKVRENDIFTVDATVKNTSNNVTDFYLKLLKLTNLEMFGDITQKFSLEPGEERTLTFQIKVMRRDRKKGSMQMVAILLQYDGADTQQRYFDYKYIKVE